MSHFLSHLYLRSSLSSSLFNVCRVCSSTGGEGGPLGSSLSALSLHKCLFSLCTFPLSRPVSSAVYVSLHLSGIPFLSLQCLLSPSALTSQTSSVCARMPEEPGKFSKTTGTRQPHYWHHLYPQHRQLRKPLFCSLVHLHLKHS